MTTNKNAPIAYFAFNRPEHTLQSLSAIKNNLLAEKTDLYIFCDGPRPNETNEGLAQIEKVRAIARSIKWCGKVTLNFKEENLGLFASITEGITQVVNRHEKVIVIEDDIIVSNGFLKFINEALGMYENDEHVMHISGYSPFEEFPIPYQETTFFYNHTYCWGWGTWKRAWDFFIDDGYELMKRTRQSGRKSYINLDNTFEFYWGLKFIHERKFQDWNYNWHVSVALNNGFCIHPVKTLTNNIGFDGSGTHCTSDEAPKIKSMPLKTTIEKIKIEENIHIRRHLHKRSFKKKVTFLAAHWIRFLLYRVK